MHFLPRIKTLLALLGLGFASALGAQAASSDATPNTPTARDTSLLWRISGKDVETPSYLFGTIHLIPSEDYFLENVVVRAMNDVDEVFFEVDPREMTDPANIMGIMSKINMRGDTTLSDLLTPARLDSVASYFNDLGMPFMFFQRMKPMFLSAMVGQEGGAGNPFMGGAESSTKSYEMELTQLAEAADKSISGLETMDFQLALFDSIPYSVQAEMLYQSIASELSGEGESGGGQYAEMVAMYKRKAVAEMSAMITTESEGYGDFEELLVVRRNENWVPNIVDRLTGAPALYAVGAGHLGGDRGVIALLRDAGYTVEPVYE